MNTRSEAPPPVIDEGVVEIAARGVKSYLAAKTGFASEYDDEGTVAAYYGGHWVTLDTHAIARAALEAGCAGLVAEKWQPIETAPKDGTTVLLVEQAWGGDLVVTPGSYNEDYHGWWEHGSHPTDYADQPINNPSCWMPLPEPPRTALRGDREQGEG